MIEIFHKDMVDASATKAAYNTLYKEKGINQRDSFYLWIIHLLNPVQGGIFLDSSCGQGRLVNLAKTKGQRAIGMDFAIEGLVIGSKYPDCAAYNVADGECLPLPSRSVDYVTHIGSLEHYMHPELGAKEIGRILKSSGKAAILLPNAFGLFGNIRYVMRYGDVFDDGQPVQRYATYQLWYKILKQGGLKVIRVKSYCEVDFPRTWNDFFWLIKRPQKIFRWLISFLIPLNLANHLVFICVPDQKKED